MINLDEKQKGITLVSLIVTIIVLVILAGISVGILLGSTDISQHQNSIIQRQKEQEDCEHDWVITSKYDYFRECYKTISKCSKCGKEVE